MEELQIENLNQYIDALHACGLGIFAYEDVAQSAQVSLIDIEHLIKWNSDKYTRVAIVKTEDFELLLLCWEPGQESQIHDHNGEEGWMKVIQGQLSEEVFNVDQADISPKSIVQRSLLTNHTYHINDNIGVHKITNNSNERCISLHLYVHPVESFSVYDETTGASTRMSLISDVE